MGSRGWGNLRAKIGESGCLNLAFYMVLMPAAGLAVSVPGEALFGGVGGLVGAVCGTAAAIWLWVRLFVMYPDS